MKSALLVSLLATGLAACAIEDGRYGRRHRHHYMDDAYASDDDVAPVPTVPSSGASIAPMLVEVDTGQTMEATPGEGVGVFVEYQAGGHWHLWWTCDTAQTQQRCDFAVSASVAAGAITNVDDADLPDGATATAKRVDASSSTTSEVHGIRFDTDAGATVTVEASVSGFEDGSFLFFVQDGKINGGFAGTLTNPLQLRGKTP